MIPHIPPHVLSALVDGECGADERRAAHEHLQECARCRGLLHEYSSVHSLVEAMPRLAAPESLVRDLLRPRRDPVTVMRHALRGPRRYVAAGAAAAALVVTLAGIASPPDTEPPTDVFVARHASVSAGNDVAGQVIFAVAGR